MAWFRPKGLNREPKSMKDTAEVMLFFRERIGSNWMGACSEIRKRVSKPDGDKLLHIIFVTTATG